MSIDLKFKQKFYGIVYAQLDRNSACKISGNGEETAKIQIPLKGCGTEQVSVETQTITFYWSLDNIIAIALFSDQHQSIFQQHCCEIPPWAGD